MWPFRKRKRLLFRFWDGEKSRAADPLSLLRNLDLHQTFNLENSIPLIAKGDSKTIGEAILAIREVFGVKAWSESQPGLTEGETVDLLFSFLEFNQVLKKNIVPTPTLPSPSESNHSNDSTPKPAMAST
jgi:hypothetical protein